MKSIFVYCGVLTIILLPITIFSADISDQRRNDVLADGSYMLRTELTANESVYFASTPSSVTCKDPPAGEYRSVHGGLTGNYTLGDRVELVCDDGYRFRYTRASMLYIVCQKDGEWADVIFGADYIPPCERIGSCAIPAIPNGEVVRKISAPYMPGDQAPVRCHDGYTASSHVVPLLVCHSDGSWKSYRGLSEMPICEVASCLPPFPIQNGQFKVLPSTAGTISPVLPDMDGGGLAQGMLPSGTRVVYYCNSGYRFDGLESVVVECSDGAWNGPPPQCQIRTTSNGACGAPPPVSHSTNFLTDRTGSPSALGNDGNSDMHAEGTRVVYLCDQGYRQHGSSTATCIDGEWTPPHGPTCMKRGCESPPALTHGDFSIVRSSTAGTVDALTDDGQSQSMPEGTTLYYYCHNGYRMNENNATSALVCTNGEWMGQMSACVKRTNCDAPMDIPDGNWVIQSRYADFRIGVHISYECEEGFKAVGVSDIECLTSGYWSDYPPRCLPTDQYCSEPSAIPNGFYMCKPSHCDFFRVGTEVHYACNKNYEPRAGDDLVQTCLSGGRWSSERPDCQPVDYLAAGTSGGYMTHLSTNTVTVVVATSCGVLGLLVIVMVVVALQRRLKSHAGTGRLCPVVPGPMPPPPYGAGMPPHHGSLDEHDRLALIAFADDNRGVAQVPLPSYEEATGSGRGAAHHHFNPFATGANVSRSSSSRSSHSRADYRPLTSGGLRVTGTVPTTPGPPSGDAQRSDHHRNSIITTASNATRDNLSMAFGSMDTVNVSDGTSTSVTVDTYDSMASNPSITASQRAAAGSIESSSTHGSIAMSSEVMPLLDHREYRDRDAISMTNSDTMRSQTSRSTHSDAAPIIEVPEDGKDE